MPYQALDILAVNGDAEVETSVREAMQGDHSWSLTAASVAGNRELLARLRDQQPDLLLLDARDGRVDPDVLAAELGATIPPFPIVVIHDRAAVTTREPARAPYDLIAAADLQPRLLRHVFYNALERAQLRRELQATEERWRVTADASPVLIWETDAAGRLTFVNVAWLAFTGRSLAEALEAGRAEGIYPADQQRALQQLESAFAARRPFKIEYRMRFHDGSYRWLLDQGQPRYDPAGLFLGYSGSCTDIDEHVRLQEALLASETEAHRHLAHLQAVYATAPVGLAFTDLEHRYTSVNERLAAFSGFTVEEMLGRRVDELMPGPIGERAMAYRQAVIATGEPVISTELQAASPANPSEARSWLGRYFPVLDGDGQIMGVNVVVMEITEQKRLEENLEAQVRARTAQARKLATDLTLAEQRERRRIARVLHDDIQQKLYALQVHVHILGQSSALRELPETSMRTELIGRLIDELIEDNSRLSVELSPPTISHEGLVDALGWLRQYISQEHGLNIHLQATGDLTIHDPDLREVIFQMVRELLLNVARHAGVSEASLTLRREQDNLVIHVADEGAGFDPELVLASTDEETTFGIRTLRERVDIFGGSLDVDSSPGAGTRITLVMPVAITM